MKKSWIKLLVIVMLIQSLTQPMTVSASVLDGTESLSTKELTSAISEEGTGETDAEPGDAKETSGTTEEGTGETDAEPEDTKETSGTTEEGTGETDAEPGDAKEVPDASEETDADEETEDIEATEAAPIATGVLTESAENDTDVQRIDVDPEYVYQAGGLKAASTSGSYHGLSVSSAQTVDWASVDEYIYGKMKKKQTSISLSGYEIPVSEARGLVSAVVNEHPDLYAVDVRHTAIYYSSSTGYCTGIEASYLTGYDDTAFDASVSDALAYVQDDMSDMQKAVVLHDYLVLNCEYYSDTDDFPDTVYDAYAVLVDRKAVCQGYALAYKYLLAKAGITCYMVTSDTMCHAWNMIVLDDVCYQVDVTWDDPLYDRLGSVSHAYMFLSNTAISSDHSDWSVTYRNGTLDLTANDTRYDNAFWTGTTSPLVMKGSDCYYLDKSNKKIVKRTLSSGSESTIYTITDLWRPTATTYYPRAYSGLFQLGERLYFNTPDYVYSMTFDGEDRRVETALLSGTEGSVYGCVYRDGLVYYVLYTEYDYVKETPLTTELLHETVLPVTKAPVFSPEGGTVDFGEAVSISAEDGAVIYYTTDGSTPETKATQKTMKYTSPISVEQDMTIKALAVRSGASASDVVSASYTVCTNELLLNKSMLQLKEGEQDTVSITKLPTLRSESDVDWSSDDPQVATVDAQGNVEAVYEGETTITASVQDHKDRTVTATVKVTVEAPVYKVRFIGDENADPISEQQVKARTDATAPAEGSFDVPHGYKFKGWRESYTNIQKDTDVYAEYEAIVYKISYELDGGTNCSENPTEYTIESDTIQLQEPEREGFGFAGWYTNEECSGSRVSAIEQGSTGNKVFYAKWKDERGLWFKVAGASQDNTIPDQAYTGKAVKPELEIYYGSERLRIKTDYQISYQNNTKAYVRSDETTGGKVPTVKITGKGNFAQTLICNFDIKPQSLEDASVVIDNLAVAYNKGKKLKATPQVYWNGKKLSNNKDYVVEYPEESEGAYAEPGTYDVIVRAKEGSNFAGSRTISMTVTDPKNEILFSKVSVGKLKNRTYNGQPVTFSNEDMKLTYKREKLVLGVDYEIVYQGSDDYTGIGTHELLLRGKGSYQGERRITFKITGQSVKGWKMAIAEICYNGEDQEPQITVTDAKKNPIGEENYTLSFHTDCREAGTKKVTLTGVGAYTGTISKTFKLKPCNITENEDFCITFKNDSTNQLYQKDGAKPEVVVTYKGVTLLEGTDYSLSYANNKSVSYAATKQPVVTVTGKGNFTGKKKVVFDVIKQDLAQMQMTAPDMTENKSAGKFFSTPVLTDVNGKKLKKGTDYEARFTYHDMNGTVLTKTNCPKAGSVIRVTVTGKGNYEGTCSCTFRILAKNKNISSAKVTVNEKYYYTGDSITIKKEDLTVKVGKDVLTTNQFDIIEDSYVNNLKKGTAKVTIRGKGEYGGTKTISFRILPQIMKWWFA